MVLVAPISYSTFLLDLKIQDGSEFVVPVRARMNILRHDVTVCKN